MLSRCKIFFQTLEAAHGSSHTRIVCKWMFLKSESTYEKFPVKQLKLLKNTGE